MEFINYCKDFIRNNIELYIGTEHYGSDFSIGLCENINANGTVTNNTRKSIELMKEWWDECAVFVDYAREELCTDVNPFKNPDSFITMMVINGVEDILAQTEFISQEVWDDEFVLTEEIANRIVEEMDEVTELNW